MKTWALKAENLGLFRRHLGGDIVRPGRFSVLLSGQRGLGNAHQAAYSYVLSMADVARVMGQIPKGESLDIQVVWAGTKGIYSLFVGSGKKRKTLYRVSVE